MRDNLTKTDMTLAMRKLCLAFGKPFGAQSEALVDLWYEKLRWFPSPTVAEAVDAWIERDTRFPTINAILVRVKGALPRTDRQRNIPDDREYLCPTCRTPETKREWEVQKRSRRDDRPVVRTDGAVAYVVAHRFLCDCEWQRQTRTRS